MPGESVLLREAYKNSGLTVADLAIASGLSVATLSIALSGIRYRDDGPRPALPTDLTLVRLGGVLGIDPDALSALGRNRAAAHLRSVYEGGHAPSIKVEQEAIAAAAARNALVQQVLSVFTTVDLKNEIRRREGDFTPEPPDQSAKRTVWVPGAARRAAEVQPFGNAPEDDREYRWAGASAAERKAAARLEIHPGELQLRALYIWELPLEDEIARRAGNESSPQKRGRVLRILLDELREDISTNERDFTGQSVEAMAAGIREEQDQEVKRELRDDLEAARWPR